MPANSNRSSALRVTSEHGFLLPRAAGRRGTGESDKATSGLDDAFTLMIVMPKKMPTMRLTLPTAMVVIKPAWAAASGCRSPCLGCCKRCRSPCTGYCKRCYGAAVVAASVACAIFSCSTSFLTSSLSIGAPFPCVHCTLSIPRPDLSGPEQCSTYAPLSMPLFLRSVHTAWSYSGMPGERTDLTTLSESEHNGCADFSRGQSKSHAMDARDQRVSLTTPTGEEPPVQSSSTCS